MSWWPLLSPPGILMLLFGLVWGFSGLSHFLSRISGVLKVYLVLFNFDWFFFFFSGLRYFWLRMSGVLKVYQVLLNKILECRLYWLRLYFTAPITDWLPGSALCWSMRRASTMLMVKLFWGYGKSFSCLDDILSSWYRGMLSLLDFFAGWSNYSAVNIGVGLLPVCSCFGYW